MNVLAVLQARMASSRLPGKVLRSIMGRPMLARQLDRVHRSRLIERLVVAISDDPSDDPLAEFLVSEGIGLYRGSLDDVLDRVYRAAAAHDPGNVVRLTGDCPLADPDLIDRVIEEHLAGGFDYSSNCLEPTWPDGLDTEVMRFDTLDQAWKKATLASEREHVTPFIHNRPELFRLHSIKAGTDLSRHRWTVDEPEDLELVTRIYAALLPRNPEFTTADVLEFLERNPQLALLNRAHHRNEGYQRSLRRDRVMLDPKRVDDE